MLHPAEQINECNLKIVNGEYDEAIVALTGALRTVQLVLSGDAKIAIPIGSNNTEYQIQPGQNKFSSPSSSACYEYDFFSSADTQSFLKTSNLISIDNLGKAESPAQIPCILFRNPIMVLSCKSLAKEVCKELCYVIIYNLALSHHLKSFETGIESRPNLQRAYLKKALALYEHSQSIQLVKEIEIGGDSIHSMATISSLMHIHSELGDSRNAGLCAEYLLSTIMYTIYCGGIDLSNDSIDGFIDMVLPLISQKVSAEAA